VAIHIDLAIPPLTPRAAPAEVEVPIVPLLVKGVGMIFPTGCAGLVRVWFEYQAAQIWPDNPFSYFRGNGQNVAFAPNLWLEEEPLILLVRGYNEDDTYTHTVYVTLDVEFKGGLLDQFRRAFTGGASLMGLPGR
jgi:hypothetical protein